MNYKKLKIYTDGGARGNPGPAGIGAVIQDENNKKIAQISEYIGETTNNQAEYRAVLAGLKKAKEFGAETVDVFLDSKLVAEQLKQNYKVKNKDLALLFIEIWNLSLSFKKVNYNHIPRGKNKAADILANLAMDRAS